MYILYIFIENLFLYICIYIESFPEISADKESAFNARDPVQFLSWGDSPGEGIGSPFQYSWASLVAQLVKNPPAMRGTWVRSLGWEDPLAWRIPWIVHGLQRVEHE